MFTFHRSLIIGAVETSADRVNRTSTEISDQTIWNVCNVGLKVEFLARPQDIIYEDASAQKFQ
jgi:hypothetical protein